ncbi:MAG: hypothetical protein GQ574_04250 [Crocinitomix sp.]|nr:hypothetical protein [Crocinitomix sp.]
MTAKDISNLISEIEATEPIRLQVKGSKDGEDPRSIGFYNAKKQFVPDIVARYANKRDYYAIEKNVTEKDIPALVFKWILFAAEARKTTGAFFLVIPKAKAGICEALILDKQLDINLIKL